jgi:hypothetical protein
MIGKLVDDEVIPTAIVIKNIPFAVQKETLLAIIVSLTALEQNTMTVKLKTHFFRIY